jgi:hypothetical protein
MRKGNNGEIKQANGRLLMTLNDWWLKDGAFLRAEYEPPCFFADDDADDEERLNVVLRNGDAVEVDDLVYVDFDIYRGGHLIRGIMLRHKIVQL